MIRKIAAAALALILALGDPSWAAGVKVELGTPIKPGASIALPNLPSITLTNVPQVQVVHDIPVAALPQLNTTSQPLAPEQLETGVDQSAEHARRWDGLKPLDGSAEPVLAAEASAATALTPALQLNAPTAKNIPMPRTGLAKSGMVAGWTGLSGLAALTHAPFDRPGVLIGSVALGLVMGLMTIFFAAAASQDGPSSRGEPPGPRPVTGDEREKISVKLRTISEQTKIPPPKRLEIYETDLVNAQAGGGMADDYQVNVWGGVLDLPRDQQEAILRHEIGHIRHADTAWGAAHYFISAMPPSIALLAGIHGDWRSLFTIPFVVASVFAMGAIRKLNELQADQFAASTQGTAQPLIGAFETMKRREAEEAAKPPRDRWEAWGRKFDKAWDKVAWIWRAHPSMDYRIKKLRELEKKG